MKLLEKNIQDSYMVEQASPSVQRISTLELWIPALFKLKKNKNSSVEKRIVINKAEMRKQKNVISKK